MCVLLQSDTNEFVLGEKVYGDDVKAIGDGGDRRFVDDAKD